MTKKFSPETISFAYTPQNERQRIVHGLWPSTTMFCLVGKAGTGKTTAAIGEAMRDVLAGRAKKIYLARPMIGVDEDLGFIPGDLKEKISPWMRAFEDVLGSISYATLESMEEVIEISSVGMLRGRTIKYGTLIVDEAQNCTWNQLKMLGSRVGDGAKVVLAGDTEQYDRPHRKGVPLAHCAKRVEVLSDAKIVEFLPEDQRRSRFVQAFLDAME